MSNRLTDPKNVGPGIWYLIHCKARDAVNEPKKLEFRQEMAWICSNMRCEVCHKHCLEYIDQHPMDPYWNLRDSKNREIGLFKWVWAFHNAVNNRLGKPLVEWKTAFDMYYDQVATCTTTCGA